jgi:hypothetical protein
MRLLLSQMLVEILYFDGCPNYRAVRDLVELPDVETAQRLRFLGSPSVRVDGRDVEPGADDRDEFMLACRVYMLPSGLSGQPDERWLRSALSR